MPIKKTTRWNMSKVRKFLLPWPHAKQGSVAMEYIVVSLFALVVASLAISIASKMFKDKLTAISEQSEIEINPDELEALEEFGGSEE